MPGKLSLTNDCTNNAKQILGTNLCKKYNLCYAFLIRNYHHMSKMCNISVEQTPEEGTNGATNGNMVLHIFTVTYIFCRRLYYALLILLTPMNMKKLEMSYTLCLKPAKSCHLACGCHDQGQLLI